MSGLTFTPEVLTSREGGPLLFWFANVFFAKNIFISEKSRWFVLSFENMTRATFPESAFYTQKLWNKCSLSITLDLKSKEQVLSLKRELKLPAWNMSKIHSLNEWGSEIVNQWPNICSWFFFFWGIKEMGRDIRRPTNIFPIFQSKRR